MKEIALHLVQKVQEDVKTVDPPRMTGEDILAAAEFTVSY